MKDLTSALKEIAHVFELLSAKYVVMGGMAVRIHGIPRPTYDVDFTKRICDIGPPLWESRPPWRRRWLTGGSDSGRPEPVLCTFCPNSRSSRLRKRVKRGAQIRSVSRA
jgi:hypothetical protein